MLNKIINVTEPLCPCLVLPDSFKEALATMMDVSLLKNPVFLLIGISNLFGMAGLYVPFVYLLDAAVLDVSRELKYSFYLQIISYVISISMSTIFRILTRLLHHI